MKFFDIYTIIVMSIVFRVLITNNTAYFFSAIAFGAVLGIYRGLKQ